MGEDRADRVLRATLKFISINFEALYQRQDMKHVLFMTLIYHLAYEQPVPAWVTREILKTRKNAQSWDDIFGSFHNGRASVEATLAYDVWKRFPGAKDGAKVDLLAKVIRKSTGTAKNRYYSDLAKSLQRGSLVARDLDLHIEDKPYRDIVYLTLDVPGFSKKLAELLESDRNPDK
jgi:hypothetical protein